MSALPADLRSTINAQYIIRLSFLNSTRMKTADLDSKKSWLRSAGALYKDIGHDETLKICKKVLESDKSKQEFRIYGRFKVVFMLR